MSERLDIGRNGAIHKKVGKVDMVVIIKIPFKKWIQTKMSLYSFKELTIKKKEELFLFWKHGSSYPESNQGSQVSDMNFLRVVNQIPNESWEKMNEGIRYFFQTEKKFIERCFDIWKSIDDGSFYTQDFNEKTTKEIEQIKEVFEGSEVV